MKKMAKKILAGMLACTLVLGLNPAAALATGEGAGAGSGAGVAAEADTGASGGDAGAQAAAARSIQSDLDDQQQTAQTETATGLDSAAGSTVVKVIGREDVPDIPDDQLDALYANQDASNPAIFDARLLGRFASTAQLACGPADASAQAAFKQAGAGHGTAEKPSYLPGQTWELSATVASGSDEPVSLLKKATVRVDKAQYDAALASGDWWVAALEPGDAVPRKLDKANCVLEQGKDAQGQLIPDVYYLTFLSSNTDLGSYALMYQSNKSATVTASVAADADGNRLGSINPAGTADYAISDLDPAKNAVHFTFTPDDGCQLADVTVNGASVMGDAAMGENCYDLALAADGVYAVVASFARVTDDGTHGDVKMLAVAEPAAGNADRSSQITLSVGDAGRNPETFKWGTPASADFSGTGVKLVDVLVAEVADGVDLANPANVPAPGDAAWKPAGVLGHTYNVGALCANTVVKFVYQDGTAPARQQFKVDIVPTAHGSATLQGEVFLGDTAVIDVVPDANWEVGTATLTMLSNGQPVAGSQRDVSDEARKGQVRIKSIASDWRLSVTFRSVDRYYLSAMKGGSLTMEDGTAVGPESVRVLAGQPVTVKAVADEGYVIDAERSVLPAGLSFTWPADGSRTQAALVLKSQPVPGDHAVTVAFKPDTSGAESDLMDVTVDLKVDVDVDVDTSVGAACAGGTVTPTHVVLKRGQADTQTFQVFPNDDFDVKSVTYKLHADASTEVLRPGSGLTLLTKERMDSTAHAVEQRSGGLFDLFRAPAAYAAEADGADAPFGYEFTVDGITEDLTIYVEFEQAQGKKWADKDTVVIDSSAGGYVSPSGELTIAAGYFADVDLLVVPDAGHKLQNLWLISDGRGVDVKDRIADGRVTLELSKGMKVYAQFAKATAAVTVENPADGSGTITPSGALQLPAGDPYTFYMKAAEGKQPVGLKVTYADGTSATIPVLPGQVSATVPSVEDGMVIAPVFADGAQPGVEWFTLEVLGATGGGFAEAGTFEYPAGATAQLTVMPADGYMLDEWAVFDSANRPFAGASFAAESNLLTIAGIDRDLTAEATFKVVSFHTISFESENEGGHVQVAGAVDGKLVVLDGQQVVVQVVADEGYVCDGAPTFVETEEEQARGLFALFATPRSTQIDYDAATGIATFTAVHSGVFKTKWRQVQSGGTDQPARPYDFYIDASAGEHGAIEPAGHVGVYKGSDAAFTLKPDRAYQVKRVVIDGEREILGPRTQYVFHDVQGAHRIHVEFEPRTPAGANDPAARTVRRLQALASTGDLAMIGAMGLLALALGSAGIAVMSRSRRRPAGAHAAATGRAVGPDDLPESRE